MPLPVLGVCLGMQALAHAHGGAIVKGPEPIHGRISNVRHTGHPLFAGIPSGGLPMAGQWHAIAQSDVGLFYTKHASQMTSAPFCLPACLPDVRAAARGS